MKLSTRFWLSGAVLPLAVMGSVLFGADRLFHRALDGALDRALLAQAAIESVSLFDGPRGEPHLHMATSPLIESVRPFAPEGALFGPDGEEVMRYPPVPAPRQRERLLPSDQRARPVLETHEGEPRQRTLTVTVVSPSGQPYALRLSANLAQLDAAASTLHRLAGSALLITALVLILVQSIQARSLSRRLGELTRHADAMRVGALERTLPAESRRDELAALRDALNHATLALKRSQDARARFVADAAHELRTPLTLMRTGLDLALRRERSNDELKLALQETREEVERLTTLSTRLLDLAAAGHNLGERQPTELRALLRQALDAARAEAEQRALRLELEPLDPVELPLFREPLRGAVDNLLSNALKYAHERVRVRVSRAAGRLCIHVSDDGPGFPERERALVFEPFYRAEGALPGAGLGLALVREVARAHGGDAYVADSEHGAEVVLALPG